MRVFRIFALSFSFCAACKAYRLFTPLIPFECKGKKESFAGVPCKATHKMPDRVKEKIEGDLSSPTRHDQVEKRGGTLSSYSTRPSKKDRAKALFSYSARPSIREGEALLSYSARLTKREGEALLSHSARPSRRERRSSLLLLGTAE